MKYYVIYALKHDDKPIYVGCTTQPLKDRLRDHRKNSNKSRLVRGYMDEHGRSAITIEPLSQHSDKAVAHSIETHYIQKWSPCCNGNSHGQDGVDKHTPETRAKMSASSRYPVWQHYDEIVRLYNDKGLTQQEIADKFGCGRTTIQDIIKQA